jgi:hypothetical protein
MRGTVFAEKIVCPANDEFGHQRPEFFKLLVTFSFDFVACGRITTTNDEILKVAAEVALRAQEVGIGKVE